MLDVVSLIIFPFGLLALDVHELFEGWDG